MSLLLDALQRASKDKEKAAAAQPAALPSPPYEMELTLEMPKAPAPPPPLPPEPRLEPQLDPMPEPEPRQEIARPASTPVPLPPANSPALAPVSPAAAVEPANVKPVAVPADRAAQEIRRAYASQKTQTVGRGRRVLAWAVLAGLLVLAAASVLLGMWGDPSALLRLVRPSSVTPVSPLPATVPAELPPATPPSAPASVAVGVVPLGASAAPQGSEIPPPVALNTAEPAPEKTATRSRTAPTPRRTEEEGLAPPPAKPTFAAKASEPSALELGYAALVDGRFDEATQAYERSLKANPDERDALLGLAYINHKQGRLEDARTYYRKVLRNDPGNANANSGLLELDMDGDATRSAGRARDLASRRPDSAAAMAAAGTAFVRDGLLADAATAFARAQALEPGNPLHAYNYAVALDRLGQLQQAIVQYERALNLPPISGAGTRSYQVDAVRLRVDQLRRALDKQNGLDE